MSDTEKGVGRGRGKYAMKGVQADQQAAIDDLDARVTALEAAAGLSPPEPSGPPEPETESA